MFNKLTPLAIGFAVSIVAAQAVELDDLPPSITVTGEGKVSAKPDMAQIQIGVVSEAKTAQEALQKNSSAMSVLMKTLQGKGVAEKDILTSNFSVSPQYSYQNDQGRARPPLIVGYNVTNSVHTKVRNLNDLGPLLDAVVSSGANNVNGISFSLANPNPQLDESRRLAMSDAKRKADVFASASGIKTGKVLYITESGGAMPPPRPMMMEARMSAVGGAVPIAAGEQELATSVTVVYAIESAPGTAAP